MAFITEMWSGLNRVNFQKDGRLRFCFILHVKMPECIGSNFFLFSGAAAESHFRSVALERALIADCPGDTLRLQSKILWLCWWVVSAKCVLVLSSCTPLCYMSSFAQSARLGRKVEVLGWIRKGLI